MRSTAWPNLLFILTDDGVRMDAAFCTNAIYTPSRASILTGTYNHVNQVTTLDTPLDNSLWTFPQALQDAGIHERGGYVTDLITEDSIEFIDEHAEQPFALFCHRKVPHRSWEPAPRHFTMYDDVDIPDPHTFRDDLAGRPEVIKAMRMHMMDLDPITDLNVAVPEGLSEDEEIAWRYQRFMRRYLGVIAAVDESIGRLLDHLEERGILDNTIVVYTSNQGFFLGDHGWFDKRLMYEESLHMPLLIQYPDRIRPGPTSDDIVMNVDFGPPCSTSWASRSRTTSRVGRSLKSSTVTHPRIGPTRCTTGTGCTGMRRTTAPPTTACGRRRTS